MARRPKRHRQLQQRPRIPHHHHQPIRRATRARTRWYFEEHLEFPFTRKVRAQNAATSIKTYGEELFKQVFGDPISMPNIETQLKAGLHDLHIEIAGSPKFHALHWESMKDPKLAQPLALQAAMFRKNLKLKRYQHRYVLLLRLTCSSSPLVPLALTMLAIAPSPVP